MSKISIPGYITASPAKSYELRDKNVVDGFAFSFWPFKPVGTELAIVCEHLLTFEIPEGFDPRPQQIAALRAKRAEVQAKLAAQLSEIDTLIANLQAIEYMPEAMA